jgi:pimeloyl-ACP methyl ester carboxylesterase
MNLSGGSDNPVKRQLQTRSLCGPHGILAFAAVASLRRHGFNIRRLEDGFSDRKESLNDKNTNTTPPEDITMKKLLLLVAALSAAFPLLAETVSLDHRGVRLDANLETAAENWQQGTVLLMTHGTLAHNRMEIMATLQELFQERGMSSLAINLSLGLSGREGMYDCATPHTHAHTDAVEEIGLWLAWLKRQGVESVVLLGHSRGGNQTARFAAAHDDEAIKGVILVAPQVWSEGYEEKDYRQRYGKALSPILARAEKLVAEGKGETMLKPVDFIYCEGTAATAAAFVSYYRADPKMDTPTVIAEIDKPVQVFAGSADTVVKGLEKKMETAAQRDNVGFTTLDGADHFFRDLYAEDLADLSVTFIEEL